MDGKNIRRAKHAWENFLMNINGFHYIAKYFEWEVVVVMRSFFEGFS
jgi:hypothetical protein